MTPDIRALLASGLSVRQVSEQTGQSRTSVQDVADTLRQERNAKRTKVGWIAGAVVLLFSCLGFLYHWMTAEPSDIEMYTAIVNASEKGVVVKPDKSWTLEKTPSATDTNVAIQFSEKIAARIEKAIERYSSIPEGAQIKQAFAGKLFCSLFIPVGGSGVSRYLTKSNKVPTDLEHKLEVVFFAHDALSSPAVHNDRLSYNVSWHALFMAALEFPEETWFGGTTEHELYHALKDRQGAASARAQFGSDLYIEEELEAHNFEFKILNQETEGQYEERLDAITSGASARTIRQLLTATKPEHFRSLDSLFGPSTADEREAREAQYLLDISVNWLNKKYSGDRLLQEKIAAYRLFVTQRGQILR